MDESGNDDRGTVCGGNIYQVANDDERCRRCRCATREALDVFEERRQRCSTFWVGGSSRLDDDDDDGSGGGGSQGEGRRKGKPELDARG